MSTTVTDILTALEQRHPRQENWSTNEWIWLPELRVGTGWGRGKEQRIDAYAIRCWGNRIGRVAYEVKVSRSDFLRELKNPRKRAAAKRYATEFYFAAPKGLIKPEELPPDTGLVEVWRDQYGELQQRALVAAPELDGYPPTWAFLAALVRRVEASQ